MKVHNILSHKGNSVQCVSPDITVYDALKLMAEKNLSSVVIKQNDVVAGIFTERDYARKVMLKGKTSRDTFLKDVMHPAPLLTVTEDTDLVECMSIMTNKYVRHLPVMRGNELVGIISIGDVVRAIISEQQFTIESLRSYISGSGNYG